MNLLETVSEIPEKCTHCDGEDIIRTDTEVYCEKCGYVIVEKMIDMKPTKIYDASNKRKPSENELLVNMGLGSTYDTHDEKMRILRSVETKYGDNYASLMKGLNMIKSSCEKLSIPLEKTIARRYKELQNKGFIHGHSIELVVASLIHVTAKEYKMVRSVDKISKTLSVNKQKVRFYGKRIESELDLEVPHLKPINYISRFCDDLNIYGDNRKKIKKYVQNEKFEKLSGDGKNPRCLVGSLIYIVMDKEVTQKEVAEISGVTTVSIRNNMRIIKKVFG